MYNHPAHTTTGKAPSELLQNRKLRFKFPYLGDIETAVPNEEFVDRDALYKFKGKAAEDTRRQSKPSSIVQGDTVLSKNLNPTNKLSTNFLNEKFLVEERNGTDVRIKSMETGKLYNRNVSHLKKIGDHPEGNRSGKSETPDSLTREIRRVRIRNRNIE